MLAKLQLHSQFADVLMNYKPSIEATDKLHSIKLALLMGFSGSGRNTLISELLKTGRYRFIVSDTTRKPRVNNGKKEQNGVEYYFRDEFDFLNDLKKGEFLEAAIIHNQQVSGISIREIQKASQLNKIAISDVQTDGIDSILKIKPSSKCIFILPPSFETWMRRLNVRGEIPNAELRRRLNSALNELNHLDEEKYTVIINGDLSKSVNLLRQIIEDDLELPFKNSKAEKVVSELEDRIKNYLANN